LESFNRLIDPTAAGHRQRKNHILSGCYEAPRLTDTSLNRLQILSARLHMLAARSAASGEPYCSSWCGLARADSSKLMSRTQLER
jgi:hypothetical protein